MGLDDQGTLEEQIPLAQQHQNQDSTDTPSSRPSFEPLSPRSVTSASTTSLVLENLSTIPALAFKKPAHEFEYRDNDNPNHEDYWEDDNDDPELPRYLAPASTRAMSRNLRRGIWVASILAVLGWAFALGMFISGGRYKHGSTQAYNHESPMKSSGKKVTLDQVQNGEWYPVRHQISWIAGADGEDGLLLERGQQGKDFLVVEDVRSRTAHADALSSRTLMKDGWFNVHGLNIWPDRVWPSPDLKKVLIASKVEKNWRHSFTANYWIFDVETQTGQPLDTGLPDVRIQLAQWAPTGDSVVFTRENDMFLRIVASDAVRRITKDGGSEFFYGIPDWVYEEEVFADNTATWWAGDGQFVAFLRTNETQVPEYPVQYFVSRPSGNSPLLGEENYPEVRQIKYPKAGAPNPTVDLLFYDVARDEVFSVEIEGGFANDKRLIIEVLWADNGKVLIREVNRESDSYRIVLVDVKSRSGKLVRSQNVAALDGGWVEQSHNAVFIPADPENGRPESGYVDTVIHDDNDHLAYFTPLDNPDPIMLTSGSWEVVEAPSAVDLKNNLVYFISTKQSSIERHVYSVAMNGTSLSPLTPTDKPGYFSVSFSTGAQYALLTYEGPSIPSQSVISTPSNPTPYTEVVEENKALAEKASSHELPHLIYSTVTIDNTDLNVVERRPQHFDPNKKYPVLFHLYGGPGSQTVSRSFSVDFQSYVTSSLGYIVVTVDGRGTGYIGREARCVVRGNLGAWEANDQIETAKIWGKKSYVDEERMALWGWSYGGFLTLKTLELDAGRTFKYGMAVAPVTDWRYYDSIYTERYMHTPQSNPGGYDNATVSNVTALSQNVRWLMMHGVADDNVHMQNTLTLLDRLDLKGVENYDMRMFPDSDHGIYFHNANRIVYDQLSKWIVNAFNGEWYRTAEPVPVGKRKRRDLGTA